MNTDLVLSVIPGQKVLGQEHANGATIFLLNKS